LFEFQAGEDLKGGQRGEVRGKGRGEERGWALIWKSDLDEW
jgi:hypothetical protein